MGVGDKRQREEGAGGHHARLQYSKVDPETSKYFGEISGHLQTLGSIEEKQLLADNVIEETVGREVDIATDAACSRIVEALLPFASLQALCTFTKNCVANENLGQICTRYVQN
jgi:hypothetical protein